jgi:hypothetical protein
MAPLRGAVGKRAVDKASKERNRQPDMMEAARRSVLDAGSRGNAVPKMPPLTTPRSHSRT